MLATEKWIELFFTFEAPACPALRMHNIVTMNLGLTPELHVFNTIVLKRLSRFELARLPRCLFSVIPMP